MATPSFPTLTPTPLLQHKVYVYKTRMLYTNLFGGSFDYKTF